MVLLRLAGVPSLGHTNLMPLTPRRAAQATRSSSEARVLPSVLLQVD